MKRKLKGENGVLLLLCYYSLKLFETLKIKNQFNKTDQNPHLIRINRIVKIHGLLSVLTPFGLPTVWKIVMQEFWLIVVITR